MTINTESTTSVDDEKQEGSEKLAALIIVGQIHSNNVYNLFIARMLNEKSKNLN